MSRVLLMINPLTGRWYGRFPNGCSICSAAASVPNSASDNNAVVGTTAKTPTSCTKINGNVQTYTIRVDFKCVMIHPGGGCDWETKRVSVVRPIALRAINGRAIRKRWAA